MKINSVTTKNKTYPNFEAIKVAEIYSKINKDNTTFIYKIEKNKDCNFTSGLICTDRLIFLESPLCVGFFRSEF